MQDRRHFSFIDHCLSHINQAMEVASGTTPSAYRVNPATAASHAELSETERTHVAGLMRINHAGEVCAQALYAGQAITARSPQVQMAMEQAAQEEIDHLSWCAERLSELNDRPSIFGPFWYIGSFTLGCIAGASGDRWSLGFLQETERQVEAHLEQHLQQLPPQDDRSRKILDQMKIDEAQHASMAEAAGAAQLPDPIPQLMHYTAKLMKSIAYRI